ncbi:DNA-binding transcriptional regulator, Lrp family [Arachidicoccus rhizosphaerae]|uniref:DNA-binding transcriptional regulator, Lrp family n=1 Tax=Arachidicoccus rhizosphaerae TaxID=551991 RepID=A0A1H4A5W0_9BACT|nr:Lrp/AsnC family transcriptional regulator [Arachidicoccus rhizosphaerae]SEA30982.1 DNA-binding transcriptional regulator, Lrp family [Arachidicoccus rhizosphaerae]
MDQFDKQILAILQKDNQTPQRDIGERVGLSAAAVQRRIKRMRADGVIQADIAVLNRESMGSPITLMVEVFLDSEKIEEIDAVKKLFLSASEVQQCYYVTGESDFMLVIVVASMTEYEKLTRKLFFGSKNVRRFRTIIVMGVEKLGLEVPIV